LRFVRLLFQMETIDTIQMGNQPVQIIETVKKYGKRLFGFIRKRVRSNEDAEDILQDIWYQLSNVVNINEIDQMSGWLFRVARNKTIDNYRKKTTLPVEDFSYEDEEGEFNFMDIMLEENDNPETDYLREVFWEALISALNELPENQRQVFVWNEMEGLGLQQIADRTGENIKTIISRKGYAVKHLRKRLEQIYNEMLNY